MCNVISDGHGEKDPASRKRPKLWEKRDAKFQHAPCKPALCNLVKPLRVLRHCRHTLEDEMGGVQARKPHHVDVARRPVVRTRSHVSDQAIAASAWAVCMG